MTNTLDSKCEALEGCKKKVAFTLTDHKTGKTVNLCKAHFEQGMKAWLEPDPIIQHLMKEGFI